MSELVFYTNPQSRGLIVHWMLEELGEPYETVWLEYGDAGTKSKEFIAVNSMGKIPALKHGDAVVTEAAAICTYLAARFPRRKLIPATDDPQLAAFYRWMIFAAGPLEQTISARTMGWTVPLDRKVSIGFGSHEDVIHAIETALSHGPFICGEHFTAADVYLGSHLYFGMTFGGLDKNPKFEEYVAGLLARPAYLRAMKINDERTKLAAS